MSEAVDPRARLGSHNNADWYEAMFTAHGRGYDRTPFAFIGQDPPPPYHSNLTTTSPEPSDAQIRAIDEVAEWFPDGFGIKDGFCGVDLRRWGLEPFIEASWLWSAPRTPRTPWLRIRTKDELIAFETAWKAMGSPSDHPQFPTTLLDRDDLAFFAEVVNGQIQAGCIGHRSRDCVGLSNVFGADRTQILFETVASVVQVLQPGAPLVGYDWGEDLVLMQACGFEAVGSLRICATR